jgi:uncharacterized protein (TIGR02147 family)
MSSYRELIRSEYDSRKARNSNYSIRAFSRFLGISPAQLSQLLSGKRPLTAGTAQKIAERLNYSPLERASLLESTLQRGVPAETRVDPRVLDEEEFQLIGTWYHYAILSLSEVKGSKSDPRWIASQLGISVSDASQAVDRLIRLGVAEVKNGKLRQVAPNLRTSVDIPSGAIRSYHHQNLDNAKLKLDEISVEDREFSAITTAISRKKIPQAKKLINEFKRKLSTLLEAGEKEAVYTLAIQLFPVSKLEKK